MLPQIVTVNPFMSTRKRRHRIKNTFRARARRHHNPESRRARRRAARKGWHMSRAHNPYRHRRHRVKNLFGMSRRGRRHNPDAMVSNLSQDLIAAGIGAASAVVVDVALAYAPIPSAWGSGWGQVLTQGVGAILVGMAAGMIGGQRMGALATVGGLTVTAYGALQLALGPSLGSHIRGFGGLADFKDYSRMGAYMGRPAAALPNPGKVGAYMGPAARLAPAPATNLAKKQMGAYMARQMGRFAGGNF